MSRSSSIGSWRLESSEIELTYDDTENVMIIDGHTLPCYFTLQDFIGRMTKIDDRYWIETDSFVHSSHSTEPKTTSGIKGTTHPHINVFPNAQTFCGKSDLFLFYTIL